MNNLSQGNGLQVVRFHEDELTVLESEDKKLVALKPIVENLGLNWDSQRQKINRDPVLSKGTVVITAPSNGGPQDMTFLELKLLAFYLAKITITRVNKKSRPKLILYQTECADVLNNYFTGQLQAPQDDLDMLEVAVKVMRENRNKIAQLEQGQEELTVRLDNTPIRSDGVKRAAVQGKIKQYAYVLGGAPAHYQQAYRKLRPYFGITAFDDIPLRRYDEAMNVIQAWIDEEMYLKQQQVSLYNQNGASND